MIIRSVVNLTIMDQEEPKETHYMPYHTEQLSIATITYQPAIPNEQPQSEKEEELKSNSKCSCCVWLGLVAVITNTVLTEYHCGTHHSTTKFVHTRSQLIKDPPREGHCILNLSTRGTDHGPFSIESIH